MPNRCVGPGKLDNLVSSIEDGLVVLGSSQFEKWRTPVGVRWRDGRTSGLDLVVVGGEWC